ncbi:TPA: molecular chaperone, partial [Klebsiella pneumoniae]|nr:molecular chaperone [Klebsiella pneumoniae]
QQKFDLFNKAVAPATERLFTIPAGAVGNTISWKIINDYGTSGKEFHSKY